MLEQNLVNQSKIEVDDFYRVSVECHNCPSISAADDIDEGNWIDEDYDYSRGETEQLLDDESVCADCGEVFTVSEYSCGHYLCPECYNSCDDNSYKIRKCNNCDSIYHPMDAADMHCINCKGVQQ